ncbi:nucleoid-associated protein [Kosakonia sp. YIM B13605]|uniref:nucleoid-associated protein n=1 Tax=Kosakonia TaxID=1330547 RepID=UPI0028A752B7|nr:nucleoid-associated protein [Kosakonia sacchari]
MFKCPECDYEHKNVVEKCENCGYEIEIEKILTYEFAPVSALTAQLEKNENRKLESKVGRLWNLNNEVSNSFITKLESKFRNKNKFHNFLTKDDLPTSIPTILRKYIDKKINFKKLVEAVLQKIKYEVGSDGRKLSGVTENNIIFIHYKTTHDEDDLGRLLIVMVDKKGGFDFEKVVLTPKQLSPIDTDALRQAALFDLTLFELSYPKNDSESYVRFIQGKSKSDFFKDALGCKKDVDNARSINELFNAFYKFSEANSISIPLRDKIEEDIREYLDSKSRDKNDKSVTLRTIQKRIDKHLPDEHKSKGQFLTFVNTNEYKIDDIFEPTNFSAENATSYKFSDQNKNFICKVRKTAIGSQNSTKPVKLDIENRCLIFPLNDTDFTELKGLVEE